jgi:hypothetical protein
MKIMTKLGTVLVALCFAAASTQAAGSHQKPDAILNFSGGSVAAGIGFSWGSGTLTYKGKEYKVKVNGLSIGKVGITSATARGEVYHLNKLSDFDGNYTSHGAGMTLAGGRGAVSMRNQNGVEIAVMSTTRGADVTLGRAGVDMKIKQ